MVENQGRIEIVGDSGIELTGTVSSRRVNVGDDASPLHLYAEEIEPRTGRHLGNFPQAFTHLALINAVVHVIRAEEEADSSGVFQPANAPM